MRRKTSVALVISCLALVLNGSVLAAVPAPPVNQQMGLPDTLFNAYVEGDCRGCHTAPGVQIRHDGLTGQPIPAESIVPYPDVNGDLIPDPVYSCESCHGPGFDPNTSPVVTNCMLCHINSASPHHQTSLAQNRNCVACHGDFVDNVDDGHTIPTYEPTLITPWASNKTSGGNPASSNGVLSGSCNHCHDHDGLNPAVIRTSAELHHETGFGTDATKCVWCHDSSLSPEQRFRICEGCHGFESLHNIQADSTNPNNIGSIVIGGEEAGYGHVGRDAGPGDSDCWGCHGFSSAFAPSPLESPNRHHLYYGKYAQTPTEAPYETPNGKYVCFSCHDTNLTVERNCLACHATLDFYRFPWTIFLPNIINTN